MQQLLTAQQLLIGPHGESISPGAVLIDGDVITAVGSVREIERQTSSSVHRLDYPQGTILPGLINCHVHLAFDASRDPVAALLESSDTDLIRGMSARARQHLAAGVTTVRDLGDRNGLITQLRDAINRGDITGPRILAACAPLTPPGGHCFFLGGEVSGDKEIRERIHHTAELGADVIKVMGNGGQMTPDGPGMTDSQFSPGELRLIVRKAHAVGLPVAIHAYTVETIAAAVDAGVDTIEHCTFLGPDGMPDLRDTVAETMAARQIAASPALPSGWRRMWDMLGPERSQAIADRLRWLMNRRVPVLFGSDAGVPISQHGDPVSTLELYEHIGVPVPGILELATTASAHYLGLSDKTGALRPGLAADLIVVDGNPLQDLQTLRSPKLVLSSGRAAVDISDLG
ncbi:amidohydrolase [Longimycelium tulufanense]|uniref:Amidohydrolase n=1 Tax=Longimycelium tulufanense TaxID=907463 RepID=A0A8J3CKC6_9PSEU|nr:amidohydrolase family protein [Longimycelium tulufanense]GGM81259.1 amidohydrolase [Longimycelium tulufanense]